MKQKDNLYKSISTKNSRVVLMYGETDKRLIEQLEQRGELISWIKTFITYF